LTEKQAIYNELLVLRCCRGQKDALDELVRTWGPPLFYYIHRIIEDEQEAWSVLQETWVKVLQGIRKLREPRKLPFWLYSIARKTAFGHLRADHSKKAILQTVEASLTAEDCEANCTFDDAEQVHYGLGRISLHHREVLTLFFLQDLSIEEIAGVLEIPVGTVKSRLYHAKRALKTVLGKEAENYE
jgi:RNA polymerase sigma factor (sigma-70 family)